MSDLTDTIRSLFTIDELAARRAADEYAAEGWPMWLLVDTLTTIREAGVTSAPTVAQVRHVMRAERKTDGDYWPSLFLATHIESMDTGDRLLLLSPQVRERIAPYREIVRELGLRHEHNVTGAPMHDRTRVKEAERRAADVYRRHGGVAAAHAITGLIGGGR